MPKLITFAFLVALVVCNSCKKPPDKVISINPAEFSPEEQIKIGEAFKAEIEGNPTGFPILDRKVNPAAYHYVETLFLTLLNTAPVIHRLDYEWTVNIVQNDSVRTAFFLPGGHLYLYTGLLKFMDSESQLLGVIGHEMYYADTELMVRQMGKEFGGTKMGDILLDNPVPQLDDYALAMPFLQFGEEEVLLADAFALQIICPFQYEPVGIKYILEKAEQGNVPFQWVENRSANSALRIQKIEDQAVECGLPGVSNEEAYRNFKENMLP